MDSYRNKYLPCEAEELDESSMQAIRKQIGESEESRTRCLQILRKDLQSCKDTHPCLDEDFLLQFLRIAKFDPSKALQKILRVYQHQDKLAEVFSKLSVSIQKAGNLNHIWISPYRLENNSLLVIALAGKVDYNVYSFEERKVDYNVYSFEERMYLDMLFLSEISRSPLNALCGVTFIADYAGFNRRTFFEHTPRRIKLLVESMTLFLHPNDNWKTLHSHVPADILPEQYGGKLKQSSLINVFENIPELDEHYRRQMQFGSVRNRHLRQSMRVISA